MRGFLVDIERLSLYKQPFSINSYLVSKESNRRSRITITADQNCIFLIRILSRDVLWKTVFDR